MRRLLIAAILSVACLPAASPVHAQDPARGAAPVPAPPPPVDESHPQPRLPTEKLAIVGHDGMRHPFEVEVARTPAQQQVGLMMRPAVPPDGGMLFDWGGLRDSPMWMKNTLAPLDMLFIGPDGRIHRIAEDTVPGSLAVIPSGGPVRAVLELAAGTARRLDIHVGDRVEQGMFGDFP